LRKKFYGSFAAGNNTLQGYKLQNIHGIAQDSGGGQNTLGQAAFVYASSVNE
jgi:hypothetical protein